MRSALACVTRSRLLCRSLLRPSCGQRPVTPDRLRPYCCSSSSSSSVSSSASPSDSPDLPAASSTSPCDEADLRLKMGIMSRSSSLPDVINQFESFLLQQLIRSADPDLSVLQPANPPAHHHPHVHVEDHEDVSQEVALRFNSSADPVPEFVICLDERLLDRAIVGWWSRETRLQEEMHCSRIIDYVHIYARATVRHRRSIRKKETPSAEELEEE